MNKDRYSVLGGIMEEKRPEEPISLKVHFRDPDQVPIQHANHIFVSHTEDEFFITFAQAHPPYLIEPTKEEIEELKKSGLPARVIARLMVSPVKMKEFIDVLNENYAKFVARRKE